MPNIQDHAVAIGQQTLEMRPFDALDGLILSQIVYMPLEGFLDHRESASLAELWTFLQEKFPDGFSDSFQQRRYELTGACAEQPRYQGWHVHHYENRFDIELEMQFGACSFDIPGGQTFIAFRGTDWSLAGWKEDLNMSFMTVPSQQEAVDYTESIAAKTGNALWLGGHSKGGNLAVFAGIYVRDQYRNRIRRIYSFDGPGVDQETLNSPKYTLISDRIESFLPQSSIVGMLLYYHPVYIVVHSKSYGILQHDAMRWQVINGAFVTLHDVDFTGKLTNRTIHSWLKGIDMDSRRLLVDTLYQVLSAAQSETLDELLKDWDESALRILEALRELDPELRKKVRRLLVGLFGVGATTAVKTLFFP